MNRKAKELIGYAVAALVVLISTGWVIDAAAWFIWDLFGFRDFGSFLLTISMLVIVAWRLMWATVNLFSGRWERWLIGHYVVLLYAIWETCRWPVYSVFQANAYPHEAMAGFFYVMAYGLISQRYYLGGIVDGAPRVERGTPIWSAQSLQAALWARPRRKKD